MADDRPPMSRPLRDLLYAMRHTGCALQHPELTKWQIIDDPQLEALAWHRGKHEADRTEGFDHLTEGRLQIAHVRTWPATKDLSRSYPRLIAERRFHCLDNVVLLCPEAHDLYDGAGIFSTDLMQTAARLTWTHPGARGPLLQYLRATVEARSGHQTENTNLLMAAEYLRHDHATDVQPIVRAFEARCRAAAQAIEQGDHTKVHRGDIAVFSMPRWAAQ